MPQQEKNQNKQSGNLLMEILDKGDKKEIRSLFGFTKDDSEKEVLMKFNVWCRYFFVKFFKAKDAPFHKEIDTRNLRVYRGEIKSFLDIAFRGAAKTTRTKLFVAFCIANDEEHTRKYIKVLSADATNAKQAVTDVYNLLINQQILHFYPEIFKKTVEKREETMASFTTSTGVKMRADSVGTDQRGDIQDEARPDLIWFDDFETRKTLRSAVVTQAIWDNMEEARNGLSKDGGALYNCNYLSERGNVHKLVSKLEEKEKLITPIIKDGVPAWNAYTVSEINDLRNKVDDFAGEYLCEPSAGNDIFFDRASLEKQKTKEPIRTLGDFKMFYAYDPSHRYGSGHDVAGGVGLDSSTSVFWDFSTIPSRVVATFASNTIKPDTFGDEIKNEADRYGAPIVAVENNKFDMCIGRLKQIYDNQYFQEVKETRAGMPPKVRTYGWNTNSDTKPKCLFASQESSGRWTRRTH